MRQCGERDEFYGVLPLHYPNDLLTWPYWRESTASQVRCSMDFRKCTAQHQRKTNQSRHIKCIPPRPHLAVDLGPSRRHTARVMRHVTLLLVQALLIVQPLPTALVGCSQHHPVPDPSFHAVASLGTHHRSMATMAYKSDALAMHCCS